MGHATRSRVLVEHLVKAGHEVLIVVSGRAHGFLKDAFADEKYVRIEEIAGLHLVIEDNALQMSDSIWSNLDDVPESIQKNVRAYAKVVKSFNVEVVISDFESWSYLFARRHSIPVISVDNMQIISRATHSEDVLVGHMKDFQGAKLAVKAKVPKAYHYLVSSFFFPKVRKARTTLVPPILRKNVLEAKRERQDHVLVYQTASTNSTLITELQKLPHQFFLYGMNKEGQEKNVTLRPFSNEGFIEDLRRAKAVIAGGGYSLMGEAVHIGVPMMSVPIEKQFEQILNGRYLDRLGYGVHAQKLEAQNIDGFLSQLDQYEKALESYPRQNNQMLFDLLDEVLRNAWLGEDKDTPLQSKSLGHFHDEDA